MMGREHFAVIVFVAVWIVSLLFFSLRTRQDQGAYSAVQRIFWGFAGAWLCHGMGLVGLNAVTWTFTALFGLPGLAALCTFMQL